LIFFRRFGEVSRELEKEQGGNTRFGLSTPITNHTKLRQGTRTDIVPTLAQSSAEKVLNSVGVSRQMAHQYEKLAAIPEEKFERAIIQLLF
jgi:hypothetical protein